MCFIHAGLKSPPCLQSFCSPCENIYSLHSRDSKGKPINLLGVEKIFNFAAHDFLGFLDSRLYKSILLSYAQ